MINKANILEFIKNKKNVPFLEIVKHFKINPKQNKEVTKLLFELQNEYLIFKNRDDSYYAPIFVQEKDGILKVNSSGKFGFLDEITDDVEILEEDKKSIYIAKNNFNNAMDGDQVQAKIFKEIKSDQEEMFYGVVTQIQKRNNSELIGFLKKNNNFVDFEPIDKKFKIHKFRIVNMSVEAKINDLVVAKIVSFEKSYILVSIQSVITNETDPKVFLKAFIENTKLPKSFPDSLTGELQKVPQKIDQEDWTGRVDLRNELIVTIDGDSTKDFDDAIIVKKLPNGNFELGVHIADVSHYVRENTEIDKEALQRGTSIYLVDRVIPMLPEELSNGICSLNPNEDRFVMSCVMEIDPKGNTVKTNIFPGIINSKYRLTYKQVNNFLEHNDDSVIKDSQLQKMLLDSYELSKILHNFKINQGYIDFEISEPKIILNEDGSVKDIKIEERGVSEVLIEDFMVRANEEVAIFLSKLKLPVMYRVHDVPDAEKINSLKTVLNALKINDIYINEVDLTPKKFAECTEIIKSKRDDEFIKLMFLRTMQKAKYSGDNIGHFGLASDCYCHFTSPIRRYPDLVVHRIIRDFVFNKENHKLNEIKEKLESIAIQCSSSEQSSVEAERNSNDLMYAEFFKNKIGERFSAQIISIVKFGFFVEFANKTDALVHRTSLLDGEYENDETLTKLVNKNTKRTFTIGDTVNVVIAGVDLVEGKIDAVLEEFYDDYIKQNNSYKNVKKQDLRKK